MWGTQDWVVRNNYINSVEELNPDGTFNRLGTGIQSYGVINALIENNVIKNVEHGVFWKDHFVEDLATRGSVFESEIRYNRIQAEGRPIYIGIRASGSPEAGINVIRNNILSGQRGGNAGVFVGMAGGVSLLYECLPPAAPSRSQATRLAPREAEAGATLASPLSATQTVVSGQHILNSSLVQKVELP